MSDRRDAPRSEEQIRQDLLRGVPDAGAEVIRSVLRGQCGIETVNMAVASRDPGTRSQGLVALGDYARINGTVDRRALWRVRRLLHDRTIAGSYPISGFADTAIGDVLYHVPFRMEFALLFPLRLLRQRYRRLRRRLKSALRRGL